MFEIALHYSYSASSFHFGVTIALIAIDRFIDIEFFVSIKNLITFSI